MNGSMIDIDYYLDNATVDIDNDLDNATVKHGDYANGDSDSYFIWRTAVIVFTISQLTSGGLGLVVNAIIVGVMVLDKSFHNASNYFIANLIVADLALSATALADSIIYWFDFEGLSCNGLTRYLRYVFYQVTGFALILLTLTRYDAIIYPLASLTRWTNQRVVLVTIASWALCLLAMIPVNFQSCTPSTVMEFLSHAYTYCVMFVLPAFALLVMYTRIGLAVMRTNFFVHRDAKIPDARAKQHKRLTRMIIAIVLNFYICWGPYSSFLLYKFVEGWDTVSWQRETVILFALQILANLIVITNPLVYTCLSPNFREYFHKVKCTWRRANPEAANKNSTVKHVGSDGNAQTNNTC